MNIDVRMYFRPNACRYVCQKMMIIMHIVFNVFHKKHADLLNYGGAKSILKKKNNNNK